MGKINVLSAQVANLIAAGEVVDRPSSVVKELVENSIDARATKITVEIKNGGVSYIRVSDNGSGISSDDMPLALKRHATSKIEKAADLNAIFTLGFRGEALAAISSVSKVRIISKTESATNGTMLFADGGEIVEVAEAGCPNGTTITVEELFANVPARRKFLKKDATEASAVCASVEKIALSHPEISFKLISDGNIKVETAGDGKLDHVIFSIFGKDFAKRLIPVKCGSEGISVHGFIGRPDNVKPTRNFQNFFVNSRFVKSRTAMAAIEQAYSSYIAPERFPACVLFIDIDPSTVDVNVHPAKLEVKFSNEKFIFDTVYYAVRNALEKNTERSDLVLRSPSVSTSRSALNAFVPVIDRVDVKEFSPEQLKIDTLGTMAFHSGVSNEYREKARAEATAPQVQEEKTFAPKFSPLVSDISVPPSFSKTERETSFPTIDNVENDNVPIPEYSIIGIAFNTYIFVECDNKVIVIDKHAAHERILFETLRGKLKNVSVAPQVLLVPITVSLSAVDFAAVCDYEDSFREIGFDFECEPSQKQVKITQIPSALKISDVEDVFATMADRLADGTGNIEITKQDVYEKALYQASCKAAMKGGRRDSDSDVRFVVEKILTIPDITVCPHGRPVVVNLTKSDLDRQFGRE
ncbi:MAG: DNA mismatch repair endonuclease MutL [Clostridia bacterium]|nr:DNA mismatch repair endonuclease MutL [Clostridia bacterium]